MGRMMLRMRRKTATWWTIAGLLFAGLALRLTLHHYRPPISGDALVYGDIASNLLRHKSYAITEDGVLRPTLIRLPGYPLFLGACFAIFGTGSFGSAVAVQIFLDLGTCCLLGLLAAKLMGRRAGLWTLGLAALCPFTANYSVVPLTETLSIFCAALAFFSLQRWLSAERAGSVRNTWLVPLTAACTFAVLLRPDRVLLFAVLLPVVAWTGLKRNTGPQFRRLAPALVMLGVFSLPLTLWAARNWRVFHVIQPLAPKYAIDPGEEVALGFMRWYRTWGISYKNTVQVYWPYDGSTLNFGDIPQRAFTDVAQREETRKLIARYNDEAGSTPEVDEHFARLARERIATHPVRYYLLLPIARLANMWFQPRTELLKLPLDWWRWSPHPLTTVVSVAYVALNLAYLLLALAGTRGWKRNGYSGQQALALAMFGFVVLRSILLATLDNAEQRYTIDCFPIILLLAGLAFASSKPSAECD